MHAYTYIFKRHRASAGSPSFSARCLHWPSAEARLQGEINYLVLRRNGSSADTAGERKERKRGIRRRERMSPAASDTILSDFIAGLQLPECVRAGRVSGLAAVIGCKSDV